MIFDIVEYFIREWTMPNEGRMCRTYPLKKKRRVLLASLKKKKKSVAGQFAIKYRSEAYCWTHKTKQGRLQGRQILGNSCCCKRINTVEKQSTQLR